MKVCRGVVVKLLGQVLSEEDNVRLYDAVALVACWNDVVFEEFV